MSWIWARLRVIKPVTDIGPRLPGGISPTRPTCEGRFAAARRQFDYPLWSHHIGNMPRRSQVHPGSSTARLPAQGRDHSREPHSA